MEKRRAHVEKRPCARRRKKSRVFLLSTYVRQPQSVRASNLYACAILFIQRVAGLYTFAPFRAFNLQSYFGNLRLPHLYALLGRHSDWLHSCSARVRSLHPRREFRVAYPSPLSRHRTEGQVLIYRGTTYNLSPLDDLIISPHPRFVNYFLKNFLIATIGNYASCMANSTRIRTCTKNLKACNSS